MRLCFEYILLLLYWLAWECIWDFSFFLLWDDSLDLRQFFSCACVYCEQSDWIFIFDFFCYFIVFLLLWMYWVEDSPCHCGTRPGFSNPRKSSATCVLGGETRRHFDPMFSVRSGFSVRSVLCGFVLFLKVLTAFSVCCLVTRVLYLEKKFRLLEKAWNLAAYKYYIVVVWMLFCVNCLSLLMMGIS